MAKYVIHIPDELDDKLEIMADALYTSKRSLMLYATHRYHDVWLASGGARAIFPDAIPYVDTSNVREIVIAAIGEALHEAFKRESDVIANTAAKAIKNASNPSDPFDMALPSSIIP
jgi:hypothetical protein